jgi:hypothetical protein
MKAGGKKETYLKLEKKIQDDAIHFRFKNMSPERKLELSLHLYYSARELKKASVKNNYPDWTEEMIEKEVKRIFMYART